jgi:type IV pilus assembly protein PilQ
MQSVSIDVRDADLGGFLLSMGTLGNRNIVVHPEVQGKVTLNVRDANWDDVLDMVLKNYRLGREVQGNLIRIAPLSVLQDEYKQRASTEAARLDSLPLETRVYPLNYAKATDVVPILLKLVSPRGIVIADPRTNMIIIRDVVDQGQPASKDETRAETDTKR